MGQTAWQHEQVVAPSAAFHRAFFAANERERYAAIVKRGVDYLVGQQRYTAALCFAGYGVPDTLDAKELITQAADYTQKIFPKWPNDVEQAAVALAAAQALSQAQSHAEALEYTRNAMTFLQSQHGANSLLSEALGQFLQRKILVLTLQKSLGQAANNQDERELSDAAAELLTLSAEQSAVASRVIAGWLEPCLPELAREYRTSPLALAPNQSMPWMDFAKDSSGAGHVMDTEYALDRAFAAEQTNADILLAHAHYLENTQRAAEANRYYEQIARGTWGPNYRNAEYQAKQKLGRGVR